jgi:hypothetical protein
VCSSERSVSAARASALPQRRHPLLESASRSEFSPARVSHRLVMRIHFVVGPSLDLVVFRGGPRRDCLTLPNAPLAGFRSPSECSSADPSRAAAGGGPPDTSRELLAPSAPAGIEGPLSRACLTRFGPSSGFGHPLDGFRPSRLGRPCFVPAALMGFVTPFGAFSSRWVSEVITPRMNPLAVSPPLLPRANPWAGPADLGFRALTPAGIPRPAGRG